MRCAARSGARGAGGRAAPRWANKKAGGGAAGGGPAEKTPKIFIFIIGGCTHSEMRSVYEATREQKGEGKAAVRLLSPPRLAALFVRPG